MKMQKFFTLLILAAFYCTSSTAQDIDTSTEAETETLAETEEAKETETKALSFSGS